MEEKFIIWMNNNHFSMLLGDDINLKFKRSATVFTGKVFALGCLFLSRNAIHLLKKTKKKTNQKQKNTELTIYSI